MTKPPSPRATPPRWSSRSSRPARPPMPDIDIVALGEPLVELNQTRAEPQYQQGFGGDTSTPSSPPPARARAAPDAGGRGQLRRPAAGTVEGRGRGHVRRGSGPGRPYRSVLRAARPAGPFLQLPAARFRRQPHDAGQSQGPADRARPLPACLGHQPGHQHLGLRYRVRRHRARPCRRRPGQPGFQPAAAPGLVDRARAILREALRQARPVPAQHGRHAAPDRQ